MLAPDAADQELAIMVVVRHYAEALEGHVEAVETYIEAAAFNDGCEPRPTPNDGLVRRHSNVSDWKVGSTRKH